MVLCELFFSVTFTFADSWTVEGQYAGGSTRSHSGTVDALSDLLAVQLEPGKDAAFRPGTSRTFMDSLPLGSSGDLPTSTTAKITMVVFDDNTAIGDTVIFVALRPSGRGKRHRMPRNLRRSKKPSKGPRPRMP